MSFAIVAPLVALVVGAPCDAAVPLGGGDTSPCEGILVPSAEALRAIQCARVGLPGCRATLDAERGSCVIRLDAAAQREDALLDRVAHAERALDAMAKCPECERAWWDSPALWAGGGLVVGVGLTIAILKATLAAH